MTKKQLSHRQVVLYQGPLHLTDRRGLQLEVIILIIALARRSFIPKYLKHWLLVLIRLHILIHALCV